MVKSWFVGVLLRGVLAVLLAAVSSAQSLPGDPWGEKPKDWDIRRGQAASSQPYLDYGIHDNGYFWSVVNNNGIFGNLFGYELEVEHKQAPSFYFPRYSRIQHGYYAALWVGGVLRGDSLVTVGIDVEAGWWNLPLEFWPDSYPFGEMEVRSNNPNSEYYHSRAKANLEFEAVYTDTITDGDIIPYNAYDGRNHRPLFIEVRQTSYSWSQSFAQDFILMDYSIKNIGRDTIHDAWFGIYYVGCVRHRGEVPFSPLDDVVGYLYDYPYELPGLGNEVIQAAWIVDNDGWAFSYPWTFVRTDDAFAIAPLAFPDPAAINNFNWWTDAYGSGYNWGPRLAGTADYPLRYFSGGLGVPHSDEDKYYVLSRPEVDYSGYETAVDHRADGWLPVPSFAGDVADGVLPQVVTSFGPVDIPPNQARPLTLAYVIGESVHYNPAAYSDIFDPVNPQPFIDQLDFSDLVTNVRWAKMVYDNPGVDTDNDGDSGKYIFYWDEIAGESLQVFYQGDGVPDFRGADAPPPPDLRVITEDSRIIVRWNGRNTETYFDPLTLTHDFEGYRVYISRSDREDEAVLLASWDRDDYNRYIWDTTRYSWVLREIPFTLDSLRAIYGDWLNPLDYTPADPLEYGRNQYYFTTVDYNLSTVENPNGIRKMYPDALADTTDVDSEGRMRYYEYEYIIEDLLPSVPYWVGVTAFDFGHPPKSLEPLESFPSQNWIEVFALDRDSAVLRDGKLDVFVYPNPYRVDDNYRGLGYENRTDEDPYYRARNIYFANLPNRCTISVFSLDGDLVRRIEHNEPAGDGRSSVHRWDVISRNTQEVVAGLYYWVVESAYGTQVGKLVILK